MSEVHIPTEVLNSNLKALGRGMDDGEIVAHGWNGDEYGLQIVWVDGFSAFVGFGEVVSAYLESICRKKH